MSKSKKNKKLIKTANTFDILEYTNASAGSLDLTLYTDPNSPYYQSISTSVGTVPMTYTLPSIDSKDKKKFLNFIKKHDIKALKPSEDAVMVIDDGNGKRYSMLDLIEATDSPLNTVMYEVMIHNFRSVQSMNKKLDLICNKLKIGNDEDDSNK